MIEILSITQHRFAIWHLLSLSEMNKVIERGCCAVTWVIERLIIIYVEKWADLIRPLKSEESTESKGSNLGCGGQPYGRSQAFRSDWNSTGTFVTNLEMQCHVLDSAYVRQFLGKNDSSTRYAGLVQCTLQSLVYQVWITSWLLQAFPSTPAEAAGQPWEERSREKGQCTKYPYGAPQVYGSPV